jgi:hypothetical protein
MKKEFDLEFCFKGGRKYIHGTDVFSKLTEYYDGDVKNIDLVFHDIAVNNMRFFIEKPLKNKVITTFKCQKNHEEIKLYGIESTCNINCYYEYPEEKIVDNSLIDDSKKTIILSSSTEYSFIEHIVAMNKALVENLYGNVNGKWYFTRLHLKKNINMSDVSSLQLILKSNFKFQLTKSAIIVNDTEVGFIYFSLIPESC